MHNFIFHNPTKIVFGKDTVANLSQLVPANARVLITFGGGSAQRSGLLDKVKESLHGRYVAEFGGIEPNPRFETLMKAVSMIKKDNLTFLLAVGGGSVIDGTKFIALAACYPGNAEDLLSFDHAVDPKKAITAALPFGSVLTLPAAGSEMNCGAVISRGPDKLVVSSPLVFPQFSILDPTLTYTLPAIQVANGIVDAFIHVIEQYLTYPVEGRVQDRFAEGLLQTLIEIGKKAIKEPTNYEVRANHMWCSTLALNGLIAAGVPEDWTTHLIGHELTAKFGIDHGQTLAIVLPALLEERKEHKRAKLIQYAERVWNIKGKDSYKIDTAIRKTRRFFESLGIKTRLSDYGVKAEQISEIVQQLKVHKLTALSETKDVTPDIVESILHRAL